MRLEKGRKGAGFSIGLIDAVAVTALFLGGLAPVRASENAVAIPPPALEIPVQEKEQVAVLAGGCFWGVQLVTSISKVSFKPCQVIPAAHKIQLCTRSSVPAAPTTPNPYNSGLTRKKFRMGKSFRFSFLLRTIRRN